MAKVDRVYLASLPSIPPPRPRTVADLVSTYGACRECDEPRRPIRSWTLTADGQPEMLHGLTCGCVLNADRR